jgi:hypothetical protein
MNEHDPPPLTDPASAAPALLRDALVTARAQAPSSAQLASLAARLPLGAPPPAGPSGAAPAAPPIGAPPSILSGALIGAALGVLVSGAGLWRSAKSEPAQEAAPRVTVVAVAEAPRAVTAPPATPPVSAPPAVSAASSVPRPAQVAASASVIAEAHEPTAAPVPTGESVGAMASPGDAETEAHLLQRAQDALSGGPAQALALTEAHASRFPAGALGQEREVVAIQALVRLGRLEEARARGARFAAAFPGSAHRRRIDALLER